MRRDDLPPEDVPADLAALLAELPREIEPEEDLWTGVREAIEPVPLPLRRRWATPLGLAAAVLLGVSLGWSSRPVAPPEPLVEPWESEIRSTTQDLQAVLERRRDEMDPQAVRVIQSALADIDAAIADVERALAEDPDNDALAMALADAWQQKVHVLRNATELGEGE